MKGWLAATAVAAGVAAWVVSGGGRAGYPRAERVARASAPHGSAPEIRAARWINTAPLAPGSLRGKVVAVEFWTYG
jgi:hypothetical protein